MSTGAPSGFAARAFGAGWPPAGEPVEARFVAGLLRVDGPRSVDVPCAQLEVQAGGYEQDALELLWQKDGASYCIRVTDPKAIQAALAAAPKELQSKLMRWRVSTDGTRAIWATAYTLVAVIVLTIGLVWWQYDVVLGWVADQISPETEQRLGQQVIEELDVESRAIKEGPAIEAIQAIGGKLTAGSLRKYQWYLVEDSEINAFAAPGGYVVVHSALVAATESPEELAGVLAHEVQHIERKHALKGMIHQLGWATVVGVLLGDAGALTAVIVHQAGAMTYSRGLESEADQLGVQAMRAARISPKDFPAFFKRLEKRGNVQIPLLASHPAPKDRMETLAADIKATPCGNCRALDYDWDAVRKSLPKSAK